MKILVIQLARLGDIYQTWPVLNAIKRINPDAQLDLLVRERFADATIGLRSVDHVHLFKTKEILAPVLSESNDIQASLSALDQQISLFKGKYDQIINLSFSNLSSYFVNQISSPDTVVKGYSRYSDGMLRLVDDTSAYFFAQVGVGQKNRIHLTDIFGSVAQVDLIESDFYCMARATENEQHRTANSSAVNSHKKIVIHVGASQKSKQISSFKWAQIINKFTKLSQKYSIQLIGSKEESSIADSILSSVRYDKIENLVGKTKVSELFDIIANSSLVIGGDSAPMHIATLTNSTCLNISSSAVNFWETGPRSQKSYIVFEEDEDSLSSDFIAETAFAILSSTDLDKKIYKHVFSVPCYENSEQESSFEWDLLKAVYMSGEFPYVSDNITILGLQRLREINEVLLEQIFFLRNSKNNKQIAALLQRCDEVVEGIAKLAPQLSPLIRWYQVEKLRIPPIDLTSILDRNQQIIMQLEDILNLYLGDSKKLLNVASEQYQKIINNLDQCISGTQIVSRTLRFENQTDKAEIFSSFINDCLSFVDSLKSIDKSTDDFKTLQNVLHYNLQYLVEAFESQNVSEAADIIENDVYNVLLQWKSYIADIKDRASTVLQAERTR